MFLHVPSESVCGVRRPYWTVERLPGCPSGTLICAVCPDPPERHALELLLPEELAYAQTLEGHYRRGWLAGRICLAAALAEVSAPRLPILSLPSGAPRVPAGFAGSITRKGPLTLAVATCEAQSIGIDVEYAEQSDEKLAKRVLTGSEYRQLQLVDDSRAPLVAAAHFAIKEAVYKALRTEDQDDADFERIELTSLPKHMIASDGWKPVATRIFGCKYAIRTLLFVDQDWLVAVASRE